MVKKLGEKYKWIMLVCCALSFFGLIGIGNNVFSVFIVAVTEDLGIGRTAFTACLSLMYFFMSVGSMTAAKCFERFGMLKVERIASVVFIACYITVAFTGSLAGFYLRYTAMGYCLGLTTSVPLTYYLKHWFGSRSGFAVGLSFMGSGFGGVVFNPVAEHFISGAGWRMSFIVIGCISAVLVLIPVFFFIKDNPAYKGIEEEPAEKKSASADDCVGHRRSTFKETLVILTCTTLFSVCAGGVFNSITPYLQDIGYGASFAAVYTSVSMAALAAGKIIQGIMVDKIGLRKVTLISLSLCLVSLGCMVMLSKSFLLIPLTICMLMVPSFNTVALPLLSKAVMVPSMQDKAVGWFSASGYAGYAIAPLFTALVYDSFGSYVPAYIACVAIIIPVTLVMNKIIR